MEAPSREPRFAERRQALGPQISEEDVTAMQRFTAEFVGTFLLTLAAIGPTVAGAVLGRPVGDVAAVPAGLTVMAVILALGEISGAHLNPAVTVAFALRRDFPWKRVPAYLAAEFAGALAAAGFLRALFGVAGQLGVTEPAPQVGDIRGLVLEVVLTAGLVTVILGTASRAR
ncbi:MAG: hypothetical protein QOG88_1271, partial [Actinomycetota bacterium]|nr:hypothetical protein [Actinomycetota bacterium]